MPLVRRQGTSAQVFLSHVRHELGVRRVVEQVVVHQILLVPHRTLLLPLQHTVPRKVRLPVVLPIVAGLEAPARARKVRRPLLRRRSGGGRSLLLLHRLQELEACPALHLCGQDDLALGGVAHARALPPRLLLFAHAALALAAGVGQGSLVRPLLVVLRLALRRAHLDLKAARRHRFVPQREACLGVLEPLLVAANLEQTQVLRVEQPVVRGLLARPLLLDQRAQHSLDGRRARKVAAAHPLQHGHRLPARLTHRLLPHGAFRRLSLLLCGRLLAGTPLRLDAFLAFGLQTGLVLLDVQHEHGVAGLLPPARALNHLDKLGNRLVLLPVQQHKGLLPQEDLRLADLARFLRDVEALQDLATQVEVFLGVVRVRGLQALLPVQSGVPLPEQRVWDADRVASLPDPHCVHDTRGAQLVHYGLGVPHQRLLRRMRLDAAD
eukprot:Rhum_TRINITY_DN14325_c13_g1::Rhum_TRINITY_DN14325_c13_g1_i1::g.82889::m.82889